MEKVYFFDMDGTLCEFKPGATMEELYSKGYFRSLKPQKNVCSLLHSLMLAGKEVYVLSAVLGTQQEKEKRDWLFDNRIWLPQNHILFVPCGTNKASCINVSKDTILIDDHTPNLLGWQSAGGTGVKVLNGINGRHGRWKGKAISTGSQLNAEEFELFLDSQEIYARTPESTFLFSAGRTG